MSHRFLAAVVIVALTAVPVYAQAGQAAKAPAAKVWTQPKTAWGHPDLQGTWTGDDYIGVPMDRPPAAGTRLQRTEEEIAAAETNIRNTAQRNSQEFANPNATPTINPPGHWGESARRPATQTSLVIVPEDGRRPALTPEAQQRQASAPTLLGAGGNQRPADSWEEYTLYIRCITRGLMGSTLPVIYGNGMQIVQSPDSVAILYEMVHEARVIPLDGRTQQPSSKIRSYMGHARGRWEGNTLVIETTNFLPGKSGIGLNGGGVPTSDALKITERFTRTGTNTMNYQAIIDDPKTFVKPYTIGFPITQEKGYEIYEYACHEGNLAMSNSLSASRSAEKQQ
jgi:hypothetical protein